MTATEEKHAPQVARVNQLIDENAEPIALPEDTGLELTRDVEDTVGNTGPTNWLQLGLIGICIVAVILLVFQLSMGNTGKIAVPVPATSQTAPQ